MNTNKGVFLLLSICGIGLIIILAIFIFPLSGQQKNKIATVDYRLFEVHSSAVDYTNLHGIIQPSITTTVRLKIDGRITEDNRTLSVGSTVKKNEIIIKMERLDGLYKLLQERNQYKEKVQKSLPKIKKEFPSELGKWSQFEKEIQGETLLPDFPKMTSNKENEFISQLSLISQYYKVKNTHQWIENHFYTAPFDGTIIESSITAGSTIKKGQPLMVIAKKGDYQIEAAVPIEQLIALKNEAIVYYLDAKNDTIGKGHYLRTEGKLSDSSTVKTYFSIAQHQPKFMGTPVTLVRPKIKQPIGVMLPKTAVINDSVSLFSNDKIFQLGVRVISARKDSVSVMGLPHHCFVVLHSPK